MQLIPRAAGSLTRTLGLLTTLLFAATGLHAQDISPDKATAMQDTASDSGLTRIDTAILFYQEDGGRVTATEPVTSVTFNGSDGELLSIKLTADALTGATPMGPPRGRTPNL